MISAGIDPEQATFYLQSGLGGSIHELYTLFQSLITVPHLQRLPSLKDMVRDSGKNEMPFALLGYPILQAADILCVARPDGARRQGQPRPRRDHPRDRAPLQPRVRRDFAVPEALVGEVPTLVGTDGQGKMSKCIGNAILLSDDTATVRRKVKGMFTDPNRVSADIPGETDNNPVFVYHRIFNDRPDEVAELTARYQAGTVGDVEVKDALFDALERFLDPIRARRAEYEARTGYVEKLIVEGTERTRREAELTLREVRKAMGLAGSWNRLRRKAERYSKKQ